MSNIPKVSVVIPIYGVEKYIGRCAISLFEQTLTDIEFIFVDDCTPDNSIMVLNEIISGYPNRKNQVKIIHHKNNLGLPAARRTGIMHASGKYIAHCDSDDWVDKDMYLKMYEKAEKDNADMVICEYQMSDGENTWISNPSSFSNIDNLLFNCLSRISSWSVWNKLIKSGIYSESFIYPLGTLGEDSVFTIQSILAAKSISYVPSPLYFYFVNPSSITHKNNTESIIKKFEDVCSNSRILFSLLSLYGKSEHFSHEIVMIKYWNKLVLLPAISDPRVISIWKESYKEIFFRVLFEKRIRLVDRIRYYMCYLRGVAK